MDQDKFWIYPGDPRDPSFPEPLSHVERDSTKYVFGGMKPSSGHILRLISELEGSYQLLKYMGFEDDMNALDEIKQRYYKLYFKMSKEEKANKN